MQTDVSRSPSPAVAGGEQATAGWRRFLVRGIAASLVLAVLGIAGLVALVRSQHPRDEETFLHHVKYYFAMNGQWVFEDLDDGLLLAEGDRACRWLQDQPYALHRRGGRWTQSNVLARYLEETATLEETVTLKRSVIPPEEWSRGTDSYTLNLRETVAAQAWGNLCGADRELRETHNPFTRPPSD